MHSLWWAHAAGLAIPPADLDILDGSYETLLRARVGLHRSTARRGEVLRLEDQDAVAEIAGFADADEMMSEISAAARTIAWVSDETWSRHGRVGDGRPVRLAPGINIVEGDVEVDDDVDLAHDPTIVLKSLKHPHDQAIELVATPSSGSFTRCQTGLIAGPQELSTNSWLSSSRAIVRFQCWKASISTRSLSAYSQNGRQCELSHSATVSPVHR